MKWRSILSYKILKATAADLGDKAVDPRHMELVKKLVEDEGRFGRKNSKGFYDYPPKPAKKSLWPGLKDLYAQKKPEDVDMDVLKQRFPRHCRTGSGPHGEEGIVTDRVRPMSAPSLASALRPIPAARCLTSTAWVLRTSWHWPQSSKLNTARALPRRHS